MKKIFFVPLAITITFLSIGLRLYKINAPVADWHSFRQSDTAYVAKNFIKNGFDFLLPKYEDLSNIQSGLDNLEGYRLVEYPVYQIISAFLAKNFPLVSVEVWLRLVNIFASAGTTLILIFLVAEYSGALSGLSAGLLYSILPFGVFYGRAILPDTTAVFWAIISLFLASRNNKYKFQFIILILSSIAGALALLTKPTSAFLLLPIPYIYWRNYKLSRDFVISMLVYGMISILPLALWRLWIANFPEGIPVTDFVLNKNGIRFKGAWFYWLFAERLGKLILGYWGILLLGLGFLAKKTKNEAGIWIWSVIGILAYLSIFASGNVQHDYYQIIALPVICIVTGKGLAFLLKNDVFNRFVSIFLAFITITFSVVFSWYTVRTYYWINHPEIIEAGKKADEILPADAKVIASYNGDTTFLYQINRQGWPLGFDIKQKISLGATHYVTISPLDSDGETKDLANRYKVLIRNDKYAIIDLTSRK